MEATSKTSQEDTNNVLTSHVWAVLGTPWFRSLPETNLAQHGLLHRPCAVLGASWDHLEASCPRLGASCGRLGASCGRLGLPKTTERQTQKPYFLIVFLILSRSEGFLKPTCFNMALFTALVPSWAHLGAILGRLGAVLGPTWRGEHLPKSMPNRSKIDQIID